MKLHRPPDEVYSPFHTDASHPASRGFCDADGAAHDPDYGVRAMLGCRTMPTASTQAWPMTRTCPRATSERQV
jgi:hypothetical protein